MFSYGDDRELTKSSLYPAETIKFINFPALGLLAISSGFEEILAMIFAD